MTLWPLPKRLIEHMAQPSPYIRSLQVLCAQFGQSDQLAYEYARMNGVSVEQIVADLRKRQQMCRDYDLGLLRGKAMHKRMTELQNENPGLELAEVHAMALEEKM